jgi:hypothetical protein
MLDTYRQKNTDWMMIWSVEMWGKDSMYCYTLLLPMYIAKIQPIDVVCRQKWSVVKESDSLARLSRALSPCNVHPAIGNGAA